MAIEEIIKDLPKGLFNWYTFSNLDRVLLVSERESGLEDFFEMTFNFCKISSVHEILAEDFINVYEGYYDYIVAINAIEYVRDPVEFLKISNSLLKRDGCLLIGTGNRLGIKYFCGERDPFTNSSFDGIENYKRVVPLNGNYIEGRNYSQSEIRAMLKDAEIGNSKFYSVFPNLEMPQHLFAEDWIPKEELGIRLMPKYCNPNSIFLEEQYLYTDLIDNNMFHQMANAYLIECPKTNTFDNVSKVTLSIDRGKRHAVATLVRSDETVEKRVLYLEGQNKIHEIKQNELDLQSRGINVVTSDIDGNVLRMPYISDEIAMVYLRRLFFSDLEAFIWEMDRFRQLIIKSSTIVENQMETEKFGPILKNGYWDMVPLNCFFSEGTYLFFDQEFKITNCPVNLIFYRVVQIVYMNDLNMEDRLPRSFFWEKYDMLASIEYYQSKSHQLLTEVRNLKDLRAFNEKYDTTPETITINRQRINHSRDEYRRKFEDIFNNIGNRKVVIFGSGKYMKHFMSRFADKFNIHAIVDNNEVKWGKRVNNVEIHSPEYLMTIDPNELKIIVCVKSYTSIERQLHNLGIDTYSIYDPKGDYRSLGTCVENSSEDVRSINKKYSRGYLAGVFDLFHIGHLNIIRKAKEQCDYLIVGVVNDEAVRKNKGIEPFIPFEERIEMVKACQYVDEAVEITLDYATTRDAYWMYRFDCQFSGSDYENHPDWIAAKAFLQKNGSNLEFLPYTEQTSSSKIRQHIDGRK